MQGPEVSVIIPYLDGEAFLPECMASLASQEVEPGALEIIVVDNGSGLAGAALAKEVCRSSGIACRYVRSETNRGFAAGCNMGMSLAAGRYFLLLNQDVKVATDYVSVLKRVLEEDEAVGAVQGLILRASGEMNASEEMNAGKKTIDSMGQYPDLLGRCKEIGAGKPPRGADFPRRVFSVCAAAAMYRREALLRVAREGQVFDEAFFAYYEDLDLGFRLRRVGFRAMVEPRAVAWHVRGGTRPPQGDSAFSRLMLVRLPPELRRSVLRNRWLTFLGNAGALELLWRLPGMVLWELFLLLLMARIDRGTLWRHLAEIPATFRQGFARRRLPLGSPRKAIAICITRLELGGAQQVALRLAEDLVRERGAAIFVTGAGGFLREECERIPGLVRYFLPSLVRPISPWKDLLALFEMRRIFRRHGVALVHTHSSKAGILGRWAARFARVPRIVHTVHGFGFNEFQPAWKRAVFVGLERLAARITDRFVVVSEENRKRGIEYRVLEPGKIELIRAGIVLSRFSAREPPGKFPIPRPVIGSVACLKPQKAPLDFLAVAKRVLAKRSDATFLLVGEGELRARLEQEIRAEGLEGSVKLLGHREDVPELLLRFDVFLLTSLWEGLPMSLLQARAAGVPIVATQVDGNREAVEHGVHGFLAAPRDIEGMAGHCLTLIENEAVWDRIHAASGIDLESFSATEMLERHRELYGTLLAGIEEGGPTWRKG